MPGKKDVVTVRTSGLTNQKQRKCLLLDDIVDIHRKYLETHLENPIDKSKFFKLCPL